MFCSNGTGFMYDAAQSADKCEDDPIYDKDTCGFSPDFPVTATATDGCEELNGSEIRVA